jgi:DNA-binding NarL/FixJ family response regulator
MMMTALRQAILSLDQRLDAAEFQRRRDALLALLDALEPQLDGNGDAKKSAPPHHKLSPREAEVLGKILGGQRLKEIAAELDISVKTVTTHRSRLLKKLSLQDNLGLYRYGVRHGLISL